LAALSKLKKIGGIALALIGAALVVLVAAVWWRPPDLIRVGANYTAKILCSNVFLAGRDAGEVLRTDVQAPGHPLLRLMQVSVDHDGGVVRAGLFGFIGGGLAVFRPGTGCAVLADGKLPSKMLIQLRSASPAGPAGGMRSDALWPEGDAVRTEAPLTEVIANDALAGPGMRAIVVIHDGRLVAERYADGFGPAIPELGWSMTKSVMAGLIGISVKDGRLALDQPVGSALGWPAADPRAKVTIADLLAMSSGLEFNEGYGAVSDVTRMLYLEPDMAAFAAGHPLVHPIGAVWSYSSGSAVILSRIFQDAAGSDALGFVRHRLFEPLGMTSAVIETDEHGTLVGSSYMYATPRDWARYGVLLVQDGVWKGQEILPRGYVSMMASPVAASGGEYGHGMVWRWSTQDIPSDAFYLSGHDGQTIAVIPSKQVVILRMGLTPEREHYQPEALVEAVLGALR
jgi:CubicO group peptidase (beta-lactamase class C family)